MSAPADPLGFESASVDELRGHLDDLARTPELRDDPRISRMRELVETTSNAFRERAENEHRVNNALAGLLASLDYAEFAFANADPAGPLFPDASPDERQNALDALHHALEASKKLAAALRAIKGRPLVPGRPT